VVVTLLPGVEPVADVAPVDVGAELPQHLTGTLCNKSLHEYHRVGRAA